MSGPMQITRDRISAIIKVLVDAGKPIGLKAIQSRLPMSLSRHVISNCLYHQSAKGVIFRKSKGLIVDGKPRAGRTNVYSVSEFGHAEDITQAQQFRLDLYQLFYSVTKDRTEHPWDT
ncbi:MAG TPA: hypothetical protein ENK81_00190 [Euryarchaeota archaeon]|nr:hypothetical protein [Euryarchaeota archaeon]